MSYVFIIITNAEGTWEKCTRLKKLLNYSQDMRLKNLMNTFDIHKLKIIKIMSRFIAKINQIMQ